MITTANEPLIDREDNIKIYYSGASFSHAYGEIVAT